MTMLAGGPKMIWIATAISIIFVARTLALDCRECKGILPLNACDDTQCTLDCDIKKHNCNIGLCLTMIHFNYKDGHVLKTGLLCQNLSSNVISDIYSEEQINGKCDEYGGQMKCECGYDDCNRVVTFPSRATTVASDVTPHNQEVSDVWIVAGGAGAGVLALIAIIVLLCRCVRRHGRSKHDEFECKLTTGSRLSSDDASLVDGWDDSGKHSYSAAYKYSSSVATQYSRGSRGNALNHNDQHLPIDLQKIIGRGRFAEVWKGKLQQESKSFQIVSVKVFQLRNYGAWRQEKAMLAECWMRHENIIEFYASEQRTVRGRLQYWLVTAYYEQGSLAEFLRSHILDWSQFCDMAISIAKGLAYLHEERNTAGRAKIPIAHRDVKSCNILVKDDCRSCVLADFGLSLKLDPELSMDELSNAGQVGTSRYMAPELLERLVNLTDIEMFKRVDVYAMALVMWEMATRCEAVEGMASPYKPPFGDQINDHPTKQQMLLLVCKKRQQPAIPDKWRTHKGLSNFIDAILTESWDYEADARITAGCVYERLLLLRDDHPTSGNEDDETKIREKAENEANKIPAEIISTIV